VNSIEPKLLAWRGAVVLVDAGRPDAVVRPAAFVYGIPGGAAWLEPSYADPVGAASPAWHERLGTIVETEAGFRVVTPEGTVVAFVPYDREDNGDLVGDSLEWFARWLESEGRSWASERLRMRASIVPEERD